MKILKTALSALLLAAASAGAESLVILHTNDTHSNIEPAADGTGGILQRKAVIDSVRKAEKNVVLVDAGDMVQGTLYFKYFKGDVEYPLFNMMGYDIRILGNHEFDNGLEELARHYRNVKGARLSANYDFSDTPLKGMFEPYVIKKIAGKKVGFIGLNVDPESLISQENTTGLKFNDIIETANRTAAYLRNDKKCDLIVAVTHIGYTGSNGRTTDVDLARASRDIDVIIGGHSHTFVDPAHPEKNPSVIENADGRRVLVAQTGKYGKNVGYIKIDLDRLDGDGAGYDYRLIPVTDRFPDSKLDGKMRAYLAPYKHIVDSVSSNIVAYSTAPMSNEDRAGAYANWTADYAYSFGRHVADSIRRSGTDFSEVDLAVMNVGGIRQNMPQGDVTEGLILAAFPFSNHMVITSQKGSDIIEALGVAAAKGGEAVSGNVRVVTDADGRLIRVVIDDEEMDPDRYYTMATIDYVAAGNDDLTAFSRGKVIWRDDVEMCAPMMRYVKGLTSLGLPVEGDPRRRFVKQAGADEAGR